MIRVPVDIPLGGLYSLFMNYNPNESFVAGWNNAKAAIARGVPLTAIMPLDGGAMNAGPYTAGVWYFCQIEKARQAGELHLIKQLDPRIKDNGLL